MTKILFFAFPQYADFEIAHTLFFLRKVGKATIDTATIDGNAVESLGGLITQPQLPLTKVSIEDYELILLPGGDGISEVISNSTISECLVEAVEKEIPIASICASATFLGNAGLLEGKRFTCTSNTFENYREVFMGAEYTGNNIEIEERFITAKGTAFAEFTIAVGKLLDMWHDEEHEKSVFQFCKGNE